MFWLAEVFNGKYSAEEMRRHEQWARRQRAEMVARLGNAAGRGLARALVGGARLVDGGLRTAYRARRRRWERRAAIRELRALDDYILKDIGMTRADIPEVVAGMLDGQPEMRTAFRVFEGRQPDEAGAPTSGARGTNGETTSDWRRAA